MRKKGTRQIIVPNHTRRLNLDSEPGLGLPVEAVIDDLQQILSDNPSAVLQAPPGAGKTTRIPLSLRNAPWLKGRKIMILAPRRLAARAAAAHMADLLNETVGRGRSYTDAPE